MIDREYYPLAMAAKILECSEDDLIHFAATQKIQIHVLTDDNTYSRIYDGFEQLSSTVLVHYEYFMAIESKINTAPSLSLVIQDIDKKNHINIVNEPFFKIWSENLYQSIDVYRGLLNFEFDGVVKLTNFVILHSELMKLKKPVEKNAIDGLNNVQEISESERNKLLKQIGVLALMLSKKVNTLKKSSGKPNTFQIAEAVQVLLDCMPDIDQKALGNSNFRESIAEGLRLLNK
ncbi:MAG: hypothetical protein RLZ75_1876 [Pseudomonadota bacterium]